jgi:FkbM family methyltransferase
MSGCRFDLTSIVVGIPNLSTIQPKNMIEIGSRDGYDTDFISNHFQIPKNKCVVFEPNPEQCRLIQSKYPDFDIFNMAISTKEGLQKFTIDNQNVGMSSLLTRPISNGQTIEVDCIRMDEVILALKLESIDICKIDVEGATLDVLKSFGNKLDIVRSIQLESEIEEVWPGQDLYPTIKEYLSNNGFVEVFYVRLSHSQVDALWIHKNYLK